MSMLKFRAPPLPIPGVEYKQEYFAQLNRALTLYFNQLDSQTPVKWETVYANFFKGGLFSGDAYGLTVPHVCASDSTDQYAAANDTPTAIEFNTLDSSSGWTLGSPGSATATYAGVYKIMYSLQFANSDNTIHTAVVWAKVNSQDVPNSATFFSIPARKSVGNPSYVAAFSEATVTISPNDVVELYWATEKAADGVSIDGVYIHHEPIQTTPYAHPAVPSAIGSITFLSALPTPSVTGVYAPAYVGNVTVSIT